MMRKKAIKAIFMTLAKLQFNHPLPFLDIMIITFYMHTMSQYFTCAVAGSLTRLRLTEDVVGAGDAHAAVLLCCCWAGQPSTQGASSAQTPQPGL